MCSVYFLNLVFHCEKGFHVKDNANTKRIYSHNCPVKLSSIMNEQNKLRWFTFIYYVSWKVCMNDVNSNDINFKLLEDGKQQLD